GSPARWAGGRETGGGLQARADARPGGVTGGRADGSPRPAGPRRFAARSERNLPQAEQDGRPRHARHGRSWILRRRRPAPRRWSHRAEGNTERLHKHPGRRLRPPLRQRPAVTRGQPGDSCRHRGDPRMKPVANPWPLAIVAVLLVAPVARGADTVKVGSKNFTEGIILGEIITQLLRRAGIEAEHRKALGGTQILFKGLQAGE